MSRSQSGRGLYYTRDSGGKHETTPGEYILWAQRESQVLGVTFRGTPAMMEAMILLGKSQDGDLFLDYAVSGNLLSRAGLDALIREATVDQTVSHIFIPRRDRLARPQDPIDAMQLEKTFRAQGISLVFMGRSAAGMQKGQRQDVGEMITTLIDYDQAGKSRRVLAQQMLSAQIGLAKDGFSTGGRPPFGFRRWLASNDGTPVRELMPKEYVKMAGRHVVWLPGPDEELELIRRILGMLESQPASRVAATLTREGIPPPDSGRTRKDRGITHTTSGVWHSNTVTNIARNPLLLAITQYGVRSMGDQLRYTPTGPRELIESDYLPNEKPKIIRNPEETWTKGKAHFEPLVETERHRELITELNRRGKTQRGKARSRKPETNPLGARIFDLNCSWPMYREPYLNTFRYKCGLYVQSHGEKCAHNHVAGTIATQFALSCIRQKLLTPALLSKLKGRLNELAYAQQGISPVVHELSLRRAELGHLTRDLERVEANMARAENDIQFKSIAKAFEELMERKTALQQAIRALELRAEVTRDGKAEVQNAIAKAERLVDLAKRPDLTSAIEVIELTNLKLYFGFTAVQVGKRRLNKISSGVVTFGAAAPPINVYDGRTDRGSVKANGSTSHGETEQQLTHTSTQQNQFGSDAEGESLGNVSRVFRNQLELFVQGIEQMDSCVRRLLVAA